MSDTEGSNHRGSGNRSMLPPPAFPPGSRRSQAPRPREAPVEASLAELLPEGAFISPDEPIRRAPEAGASRVETEFPEEAFISPDEPIRHREPLAGRESDSVAVEDDVLITGIGEVDPVYFGDGATFVRDVAELGQVPPVLDELAHRLREDGAAALHPGGAELSRFEIALRSFIAGFFARRGD